MFVQALASRGALHVRVPTPTAPIVDDFTGTANIVGRAPTPNGGPTWTFNRENAPTDVGIQTASGVAFGSTGSASNWIKTNAYLAPVTPTQQGRTWGGFTINQGAGFITAATFPVTPVIEFSKIAGDSYSRIELNQTTQSSTKTGTYQLLANQTGTTQSNATFLTGSNLNRLTYYGGDSFTYRRFSVAGAKKISLYINGWLVLDTFDINTALTAWPESLGFKNTSNAGLPASGATIDSVTLGDPDTQALLWLIHPGHTAQMTWWNSASPTSCRVRLYGEFSGPAPKSLNFRVRDTTGAVMSGQDDQLIANPLQIVAAAGGNPGTFGTFVDIPPGGRPSQFEVDVRRTDLGGAVVWYSTAVMGAGEIIADYGQSRQTQALLLQCSGVTAWTVPTNSWSADGSTDGSTSFPTTRANSRMHPADSNGSGVLPNSLSPWMYMFSRLAGLVGHSNFTVIRGGQGGTTWLTRAVNGASSGDSGGTFTTNQIFRRLLDGIDLAGDCGTLRFAEFAFEIQQSFGWSPTFGQTQANQLKGIMDALVSAVEGYVGHPIRVILSYPPQLNQTGQATQAQRCYRAFAEQAYTNGSFGSPTATNPQRHYMSTIGWDAQHGSATTNQASEVYHCVTTLYGYPDLIHREAPTIAYLISGSGSYQVGPSFASATRVSSTQIDITYNLNGCSDLELLNPLSTGNVAVMGAGGDYRFSQTFYPNNTFTGSSEYVPTLATKGSPSGGQCTVSYTFVGPLPSTIYWRGPWGDNPLNPGLNGAGGNNATIAGNVQTQASMLRGVFSGSNANCLLQPYINLANNTNGDLSADYVAIS